MKKALVFLAALAVVGCTRMPVGPKCNAPQHVTPDSTGHANVVVQAGCTDTVYVTYNYPK